MNKILSKFDYYDTHTHINCEPLYNNVDSIIKDCLNKRIMLNAVGTDYEDSKIALELSIKYSNVFAIIGYHPANIKVSEFEKCHLQIRSLINTKSLPKLVSIGEIGLDYTCSVPKNIQEKVFINHIKLAREFNLPIQLHVREAHKDAVRILKKYASGLKKVIHCFTADATVAKSYLELDCMFSVNGIITFNKNNQELIDSFKVIPLSNLLLETDCPYLTPVPFRGKQNIPQYVVHVFNKLCEIYNVSKEELKSILFKNASNLFF